MTTWDADDLVLFQNVRVIRSTVPALLCRIGQKSTWLPRGHILGKLYSVGDHGQLLIRRWIARDRHLIDRLGAAIESPAPSPGRRRQRLRGGLHIVRGEDHIAGRRRPPVMRAD